MTTPNDVAGLVRTSVMRLSRRLRSQQRDQSLTLSELSVLITLEHHGPMTPSELAAHEKVRPPAITKVVSTLSHQGLVSRRSHPRDGRQAVLTVTVAGLTRVRDDRGRRDAWLSKRLSKLDPTELEALAVAAPLLERLASNDE